MRGRALGAKMKVQAAWGPLAGRPTAVTPTLLTYEMGLTHAPHPSGEVEILVSPPTWLLPAAWGPQFCLLCWAVHKGDTGPLSWGRGGGS